MAEGNGEPDASSELLESLIGYSLRRANIIVMADFMESMAGLAMRPVLFAMLAMICENEGINQTSLGRALGIQRANLVPLINELTSRGLVDRRPFPNDRRAFALFLSPAGDRLLKEAIGRVREHESRLLSDLTDSDRETLFGLLDRIRQS